MKDEHQTIQFCLQYLINFVKQASWLDDKEKVAFIKSFDKLMKELEAVYLELYTKFIERRKYE